MIARTSSLGIHRLPTQGGAMLYDPSRVGNASPEIFSREHWLRAGKASATPAGRGAALFIDRDEGGRGWVLRHYHRGGFIAKFSQDHYLWVGEARTRPFREYRLLAQMHADGLPVPAPVAALYRRYGLTYCGALLTERIVNAQPLSTLLQVAPLEGAGYAAVGSCIRRFHDAGIWHADLNAHNILIADSGPQVFLIDFDRGHRRAPGSWQQSNLERLQRSLLKIAAALPAGRFTCQEWNALLLGYRSHRLIAI